MIAIGIIFLVMFGVFLFFIFMGFLGIENQLIEIKEHLKIIQWSVRKDNEEEKQQNINNEQDDIGWIALNPNDLIKRDDDNA